MKDNLEYKKHKKKQKHLLKELQSAEHGEYSGMDSWETVDMKKQLHPIGYYINDREEMIRQVFTVIQGERLKKMLPPTLKDMDLDELKADCLIHLVGMSSKRIKAILEGRELDVSSEESDSDTDVDSVNDGNTKNQHAGIASTSVSSNDIGQMVKKRSASTRSSATVSNSGQILEDGCSIISGDDMLEIGLSNSELCDDFFESNDDSKSPKTKRKKLKQTHHQQITQQIVSSGNTSDVQLENECNVGKSGSALKESDKDKKEGDDGNSENKGKTLLEILELEMRARAIRALLKRDGSPNASPSSQKQNVVDNNYNSKVAPSSSEIIDLTSVSDSTEFTVTSVNESAKEKDKTNLSGKANSKNSSNVSKNTDLNDSNKVKDNCINEKLNKDNIHKKELTGTVYDKQQVNLVSSDEENNVRQRENEDDETNSRLSGDNKSVVVSESIDNDLMTPNSNSSGGEAGSSWAQRWLEKKSKDVKRLVSTSKMCTTIRNRMKKSKLNRQELLKSSEKVENCPQVMPSEFKGSIDEYNMLVKSSPTKVQEQQEENHENSQTVTLTDPITSDADKILGEDIQSIGSNNNSAGIERHTEVAQSNVNSEISEDINLIDTQT